MLTESQEGKKLVVTTWLRRWAAVIDRFDAWVVSLAALRGLCARAQSNIV